MTDLKPWPKRDPLWEKLAAALHGVIEKRNQGLTHKARILVSHEAWVVTLDWFSVVELTQEYIRLRVPYLNKDNFRFTIHSRSHLDAIGDLLGRQSITVGIPAIDKHTIITSNNPDKIKQMLAHEVMQKYLLEQAQVNFEVRDDEGWFGEHFPEGVDELCFWMPSITDIDRIKDLFFLFFEVLHFLCASDSAYAQSPGFTL